MVPLQHLRGPPDDHVGLLTWSGAACPRLFEQKVLRGDVVVEAVKGMAFEEALHAGLHHSLLMRRVVATLSTASATVS